MHFSQQKKTPKKPMGFFWMVAGSLLPSTFPQVQCLDGVLDHASTKKSGSPLGPNDNCAGNWEQCKKNLEDQLSRLNSSNQIHRNSMKLCGAKFLTLKMDDWKISTWQDHTKSACAPFMFLQKILYVPLYNPFYPRWICIFLMSVGPVWHAGLGPPSIFSPCLRFAVGNMGPQWNSRKNTKLLQDTRLYTSYYLLVQS